MIKIVVWLAIVAIASGNMTPLSRRVKPLTRVPAIEDGSNLFHSFKINKIPPQYYIQNYVKVPPTSSNSEILLIYNYALNNWIVP